MKNGIDFEVQSMIRDLSDAEKMMFMSQYSSSKKDPGVVLVASLFSLDRFLLGQTLLGILKLITMGGFFIWAIVDVFTAKSRTNAFNKKKAAEIASTIKHFQANK